MTSGAVAHLEEKSEEDSSMQQSRARPKAFTVRPDCPARHGEAELPKPLLPAVKATPVVGDSACCDVPEIHISSGGV